jgi:hypothetical protein
MHGTSKFVKKCDKLMEGERAKVFYLLIFVLYGTFFLFYKQVRIPWVGRCGDRENDL